MSQLEDLLQQCTVKLSLPSRMGWGTGFFVAPGFILTCAHVVQEAKGKPVQVRWQNQENWAEAIVERSLPNPYDLALLRVTLPSDVKPPCVYLDEEFSAGHALYAYGYSDEFPEGASLLGECEGDATENNSRLILFKATRVRSGMSGSPLLNQRTGKVCGIVKFTRDRSFDLGGGAIPTRVILEQFPQLKEFQGEFHGGDRRWSNLLEAAAVEFDALLTRIKFGTVTNSDRQRLQEALTCKAPQITQLGKYNINIDEGREIHIGDRTYVEINEEAIQKLIAAIQQTSPPTFQEIPNNLPRTGATQFVGRTGGLKELHQQLQQNEQDVVAIVGMGGVGKTELALQYAAYHFKQQTYPAGVCWLDAQDSEMGTKLVQLAEACFNLVTPDKLDSVGKVDFCWRRWIPGDVLVIFDGLNTAADYERIAPYLPPPNDARFKVLLTTREQITPPVVPLALDVLTPHAARNLLKALIGVERLRQEISIARQLCMRLGYLPLGLELVGRYLAQNKDLTLAKMLSQLEARGLTQRVLAKRDSRMTAKLGVEAAFELSWKALESDAQHLSYLLSLFAPVEIPWSLVERCVEDEQSWTFTDARLDLLNLSLLDRHEKSLGIYRLHPLIRDFFGMKRQEHEQLDKSQIDTLKQWFCQGMMAIAQEIKAMEKLEQLRAFTDAIPHIAEAITNLKEFLKKSGNLELIYESLARYYEGQGAYTQAVPWLERGLAEIHQSFGEEHLKAAYLERIGIANRWLAKPDTAQKTLDQALTLYTGLKNHKKIADTLIELGATQLDQDKISEAIDSYESALRLSEEQSYYKGIAWAIYGITRLYINQNDYEKVEKNFQRILEIYNSHFENEKNTISYAQILNLWGKNLADQCRYKEAHLFSKQSYDLFKELKNENGIAWSAYNFGILMLKLEKNEDAKNYVLEALKIFERLPNQTGIAWSLHILARIAFRQQNYNLVYESYKRSLDIFRNSPQQSGLAFVFEGFARLAGLHDQPNRAAYLFGHADTIRCVTSSLLPPSDLSEYNESLNQISASMGESKFNADRDVGRNMPLEQAIFEALAVKI